QPDLSPPDTTSSPRKERWTLCPAPPLCYVKYVASYITHCCYNYPLEAFMTTQQTPSWEAVIACHDPTQPTRYYRSYTLHEPASISDHIYPPLQHSPQPSTADTPLTLSAQPPLLPIPEKPTATFAPSSRVSDQLLGCDPAFRTPAPVVPFSPGTPSTLEL